MITLNVQVGVNPLINHRPKQVYKNPLCTFIYTIGDHGEVVAWRDLHPVFQMCPSLNAEADKLTSIVATQIRNIDQIKQTIKLVTLHNDNRLRVWSQQDGTCINVSSPCLFPQAIIALVAPPVQSKFIIALADEAFYIVDCWLLKVLNKIVPKKQAYARFKNANINEKLELQIQDGNNRAYNYSLKPLLNQHFLDFGNYFNNYAKITNQIDTVCTEISKVEIQSYYKKSQPLNQQSLSEYESYLAKMKGQSLVQIIFCQEMLKQFPKLSQILKNQEASISSPHYIAGASLFFFIGTNLGTILIIPISCSSNQAFVMIKDTRLQGSAVRYIKVFNEYLFVSWQNGWMGIYKIQSLSSHIQVYKINRTLQQPGNKQGEVWTIDLAKLTVLFCKLSSFMKYSLPSYHNTDGIVNSNYFFRLDRNEIVRFQQSTANLTHYRGISEDTKVYCVFLVNEYVGICTSRGIEMYSSLFYERTIEYKDWIWEDYTFLIPHKEQTYQYRHSNFHSEIVNANGLMKFNNRWFFDKLDYYSDGEGIFSQTFGDIKSLSNEEFPGYYFIQRGQVRKALHSTSRLNAVMIIKAKLNRVRRDCWDNAAFLIHGNLNVELNSLLIQKGTPQQIILKDFEYYMLLPWADLNIPYLSSSMKALKRHMCLKRRQVIQGVGKTFTIHFESGTRIKLSEKILTYEAVATIALMQCWVIKEPSAADHMVEAVEYFARLAGNIYGEGGDIFLAKLAVSNSQHISKASINLLISRAILGKFCIHPIFEYFLLSQKSMEKERKLLSFNETVWLVYLGLGFIFAGLKIDTDHIKIIINRFVTSIQDINNYEHKPYYLLTVMRVFNQGVSLWKPYLEQNDGISKLLCQLFRTFFLYDGVTNMPVDDKKFNFVFAKTDETMKKSMKQGIIKSIIYIGKEFPQQFHGVLKNESVNQKIHSAYPASVIQILRQYIKSQRPQTHLVFYVQLLLQCLSPITPHLRRYVQKNALTTLQLLCTYSNVAFNQPSQKLSVKTLNNLYIYCLRTSTKWRTINLKDEKPTSGQSLVEMSPKGTYIALLSDKLRVWRLSSGFWSGVLGAFSQDWTFDAKGKALRWQQNEQSVTVINQNPIHNKVFKI